MVTLLQQPLPEPPAENPGPRPQKSTAAFRTISEVAEDLDVAQHVLRFWESKFAQVRPLKRGGGRRYYRPEDVDLLRQIRSLLYEEGYTIKGAQKLLRGRRARAGVEEPVPVPAAPVSPSTRPVPAAGGSGTLPSAARQRLRGLRDELQEIRALLARARGELP